VPRNLPADEPAFSDDRGIALAAAVALDPGRAPIGPEGTAAPGLFRLSAAQMGRIEAHLPRARGVARRDDHRVISGILHVILHNLRWQDAPCEYGPYLLLYNRFVRWTQRGIFNRIFAALAGAPGDPDRVLIGVRHLMAHPTAAGLLRKGHFRAVAQPAAPFAVRPTPVRGAAAAMTR
jgi:putative transposase